MCDNKSNPIGLPESSPEAVRNQGALIAERCARRRGFTYCSRRFADSAAVTQPAYILVEDRFLTGHDDSAAFVELIDENGDILTSWMFEGLQPKRFRNPDLYDADCLVYYLRKTYKLRVVQNTWGRPVGEITI